MTPRRKAHPLRLTLLSFAAFALHGCGGGDDGDSTPPVTTVTLSGKITFDRFPFKTTGSGLDPLNPVESPARQVTVEALDASSGDTVLASTTTDDSGNYTFQVPASRNVKVRAKAEMVRSGAWNFRVLNNTNGDALYAVDGDATSTGTSNGTRNLRATSGWGATSYTGPRAAAPFAVLDTVYAAKKLILSAAADTTFPALNLYWSTTNKDVIDTVGNVSLCTTDGQIGTTFYTTAADNAGNCTPNGALSAGIYILGDFANGNGDTDEFDQHVIAHEFGHYIEDQFSRSDSVGGSHSPQDRLDLRVAFSEGWGNAYSGMVLNDPAYRDSDQGLSGSSGFNIETDNGNDGWYSEFSVTEILWDLFDSVDDGADHISLGFAPLYSVLTGVQKTTHAMTSVYSFVDGLRTANPGQAAGINALLTGESISGTDAFGSNESNDGGSKTALPIYQDVSPGQTLSVCSSGGDDDRNKLGYRRLLRLDLASASALTITATGAVGAIASVAATDPDVYVYRDGAIEVFSDETGPTEMISQHLFSAGTYIIEVYDYDTGVLPRCMTVSLSGI